MSPMHTKGLAFLVLVVVLLWAVPASAQIDVASATLKGVITDQHDALVAGATVTATSIDKGISRTAKTGTEGTYQIPALPPGAYKVEIEAQGFSKVVNEKVLLSVGQSLVYDVQLATGSVTAQIAITADAPLIDVERTQQANTISTRQVENLPNSGRTFQNYVYTLPGVGNSTAPRAQLSGRITGFLSSGFSIGGSNGRNNLITVDGGENEYGSGQARFDITPESIQEFQVNRNSFTAEFGFTAGTAVNVITKSGTNQFHGSGYIYYRSDKTSGRNFFDFTNPRAKDRQLFPGFTFGGPIVKNKLFFFTNYERQQNDNARFRTYTSSALLQPNAAQAALLATLDASTNANLQRISSNLRRALTTNATTYPNTFKLLSSNEGAFNGVARLNTWSTKVDYQPTSRD